MVLGLRRRQRRSRTAGADRPTSGRASATETGARSPWNFLFSERSRW